MFERFEGALSRLGSRRAMVLVAAVATLLAGTSVGPERVLDDWILACVAHGTGGALGLQRHVLDGFAFTDGSSLHNRRLMDSGLMLPWWTDPELKIEFFRPLAAATHLLDEWAWPHSAIAMHLHSLGWFALLLVAVALVYRRLAGSAPLAGLSFSLYALDDAHGATLSWLANRNALLAGIAGCCCLLSHDSWRRTRRRGAAFWASFSFLSAWSAGELAVGALGYLVAYALFLDPGNRASRARSLVPYVIITLAWRVGCARFGYGVQGSGGYIDPLSDAVRFLRCAPAKWLSLLQGQFGLFPAETAFLAPAAQSTYWLLAAGAGTLLCCYLLSVQVRDKTGRFWLCGMLLSLLPMAATVPSDRLLLFVGLGAMALLSRLFLGFVTARSAASMPRERARVERYAVPVMMGIHLLWAPVLLPLRSAQMRALAAVEESGIDRALTRVLASGPKTIVILSTPSLLLTNYVQARRAAQGLQTPAEFYVLSSTNSEVDLARSSPSELTLTPKLGFLGTALERHYRAAELALGSRVELSALSAEVTAALPDGRPRSVRFVLRRPLDEYAFLCWRGAAFESCKLPAPGESTRLDIPDLRKLVENRLLGTL